MDTQENYGKKAFINESIVSSTDAFTAASSDQFDAEFLAKMKKKNRRGVKGVVDGDKLVNELVVSDANKSPQQTKNSEEREAVEPKVDKHQQDIKEQIEQKASIDQQQQDKAIHVHLVKKENEPKISSPIKPDANLNIEAIIKPIDQIVVNKEDNKLGKKKELAVQEAPTSRVISVSETKPQAAPPNLLPKPQINEPSNKKDTINNTAPLKTPLMLPKQLNQISPMPSTSATIQLPHTSQTETTKNVYDLVNTKNSANKEFSLNNVNMYAKRVRINKMSSIFFGIGFILLLLIATVLVIVLVKFFA